MLKTTKIEYEMLFTLQKFNKDGGISKENLYKSLHQSKGAFEQALKILRNKIKLAKLDDNIKLYFNPSEKNYNLRLFNANGRPMVEIK